MDHQEYEKLDEIIEAPEPQEESKTVIHLDNGVVLQRIPFYRGILSKIIEKFPEPKVPTFFNKDKEREEENPSDPDYIEAKKKHEADLIAHTLDVGIARGTELVSVPKGVPKHTDKEWVEEWEELMGQELPKSSRLRYLEWVKWVASEPDMARILQSVMGMFGVTEAAVETEMSRFPSDEERDTAL